MTIRLEYLSELYFRHVYLSQEKGLEFPVLGDQTEVDSAIEQMQVIKRETKGTF